MTGNSLTVATQQVHGGGLKERLDDSSRLPFKNDNWMTTLLRVKIDGHLRIARACDGTRKSCCCTHYCSVPPVAWHTTPNRTMKVNDSGIDRYFNPYKHYKSLSRATMTKNGLIVATQCTHGGPEVHLDDSSRRTVKNNNWPDKGASKSIENSCELRKHARACDDGDIK